MHDDLETAKLDELTLAVKNCKVFNFPIQMLRNYIKEIPFQAFRNFLESTLYLPILCGDQNVKIRFVLIIQVVVCCVSDQFEQDEKCRDMFLYIKEQLFKKFAIAVIRESLQWKHSELGMKIGQPVSSENWIYM